MVITSTTTHHHHHHPPQPPSSPMTPLHDNDDDDHCTLNPSLKRRRTTNSSTINNHNNTHHHNSIPSTTINSFFNFSSAPCFTVKWGRQKHLRCIKHSSHLPSSSRSTDSLDAVSDKLILDFRAQVHQMHSHFFPNAKPSPSPHDVILGHPRPWNLRTRRALCNDPYSFTNAVNAPSTATRKPALSPPANLTDGNGNGTGVKLGVQPKARRPFSLSLSKHEIEEDFLAILGSRPARRPKKRPKYVQRQVDGITPGLWLSEITADMYKVNEQPDTGKR